jgi:hypothetical protein
MSDAVSRARSPLEPDDAALLDRVRRFRRRLQAMLLVRHLTVACALLWVLAALASAFSVHLLLDWPTAIVVALVSTVVYSVARTPSLESVGSVLDRRLRTADHLVTALALARNRDPVARLVVRGAASQLQQTRPASAMPFELGRTVRVTLAAAAAASALLVAMSITLDNGRPASSRLLSSDRQSSSERPVAGRTEAVPERQTQTRDPLPENAAVPGSGDREDGRPPRPEQGGGGDSRDRTRAESQSVTADTAPAPAGLTREASVSTPDRSDAGAALARKGDPRTESSRGTTGATGSGAQSRPSKGPATGAAPGRTGSGTTTDIANVANGDSAAGGTGGVRRDALGQLPADAGSAPGDPGYRTRYGVARAEAEAAIAREGVPRGRISYVRDYFLAIRPAD